MCRCWGKGFAESGLHTQSALRRSIRCGSANLRTKLASTGFICWRFRVFSSVDLLSLPGVRSPRRNFEKKASVWSLLSRWSLGDNEVLHNLHGSRTDNIVKGDQVVFFVFPYAQIRHRTSAGFLTGRPLVNVEVERCDGQAMQLPIATLRRNW